MQGALYWVSGYEVRVVSQERASGGAGVSDGVETAAFRSDTLFLLVFAGCEGGVVVECVL